MRGGIIVLIGVFLLGVSVGQGTGGVLVVPIERVFAFVAGVTRGAAATDVAVMLVVLLVGGWLGVRVAERGRARKDADDAFNKRRQWRS